MISLVVPCYNEEEVLPVFYQTASSVMHSMECGYEIVLVNDGSGDRTLEVMRELAAADSHVKYVSFSRNFGKEAAMYAGLCNAKGDYVAVMDADMQDPPSVLPEMMKYIRDEGCDCVAARRSTREGEPPIRSWCSRMFYRMINKISDVKITDGARDFRLMKREMVDAILAMTEYNRFSKGIFEWVGFRTKWISYENVERAAGETKWNFWGLFKYALDGILNFSQAPLSIASLMGVLSTGLALFFTVFIVVRRLVFGDPVAGWASMVCIILFVGGIQLFCLGIIGQYVAKIYLETKNRPHFVVAETNAEDPVKIH